MKLSDVARVTDSVEDIRTAGYANGKPSILMLIFRQPDANIVETVDRVHDSAAAAAGVDSRVDRHVRHAWTAPPPIRASVRDVAAHHVDLDALVIMVVFIFLRSVRTTSDPERGRAGFAGGHLRRPVPVRHYSVDNLSLMALTIATGFVVDDAIVVIENITRHLEHGMTPMQAALAGAKEIGFTVLSISISLIAVFIPILLMGGIVGRLFREFAVTLSVAIVISLFVSLTTTPMMCARLLRARAVKAATGFCIALSESGFDADLRAYMTELSAGCCGISL